MLVQVGDAIVMGGTLIMLPEDQIEEQKSHGDFDGEVADAFGEIANILAGSLTQVFLDRYPKPIRFIKTDAETIVQPNPARVRGPLCRRQLLSGLLCHPHGRTGPASHPTDFPGRNI